MTDKQLYSSAIGLLERLIRIPSFSGEEERTAGLIGHWLEQKGVSYRRKFNNLYAYNKYFDDSKPSILLNSHHDTVRPNSAYRRDPFRASREEGRLYGLGSNDAGGALVSLMATFFHFYEQPGLPYNLILAATAEEENSGQRGISSLLPELPDVDFAIVGEPTQMQMAVAERGLLVIDGYAPGIAGHAAHGNTENAIYNALEDINRIRNISFPSVSETLGPVKANVTQIKAGSQHNQVPASCHFVIDVRVNEHYQNQEIFDLLCREVGSKLEARSFRLNASSIPLEHPLVQGGLKLGLEAYGSPTLSDQALLSCPSLKIGPGDSLRSHSADEYIYLHEIEQGIPLYIQLLNQILRP